MSIMVTTLLTKSGSAVLPSIRVIFFGVKRIDLLKVISLFLYTKYLEHESALQRKSKNL